MTVEEIQSKLQTIRNNNALPEKQKGMLIDKYEKMLSEMGGSPKPAEPKAEKKTRKPREKKVAKVESEYDCDDLIDEAKERKAKALAAYEKRKNAPKKSAATKSKDAVIKAEKSVEKGVKKGDISVSEIEKIISEYEDAIKKLKVLLEQAKNKMARGGGVNPEEVEHILMKAQGIKEHHCKCHDKMAGGGEVGQKSVDFSVIYLSPEFKNLSYDEKVKLEKSRLDKAGIEIGDVVMNNSGMVGVVTLFSEKQAQKLDAPIMVKLDRVSSKVYGYDKIFIQGFHKVISKAFNNKFGKKFDRGGELGDDYESELLSDIDPDWENKVNKILRNPIFENYKDIETDYNDWDALFTIVLLSNNHIVAISWDGMQMMYSYDTFSSIDAFKEGKYDEEEDEDLDFEQVEESLPNFDKRKLSIHGSISASELNKFFSNVGKYTSKNKMASGGIVIVKGKDDKGRPFKEEFDSFEDALQQMEGSHYSHLDRDSLRYYDSEGKMIKEQFGNGGPVKTDKYGFHIEPQFKVGDQVTMHGHPGVITKVDKGMYGRYSYDVSYNDGQDLNRSSNFVYNKANEIKLRNTKMAGGGGVDDYFKKFENDFSSTRKGGVKNYSVDIDLENGEQLRGGDLDFKDGNDALFLYEKVKKEGEYENEQIEDIQLIANFKNGDYESLHIPKYAKGGGVSYNDAMAEFAGELFTHPVIIQLAKNYNKTPQEVVKHLMPRIHTKGNRMGKTTEVWIDFVDTNTNTKITHRKKFAEGGGVDDSKNKKIMESYRENIFDLRNQSYPKMSVSQAIKQATEYMLFTYSKEELIEAIKNDRQIEMFGMENTWLNALKRAKKPKMANGGGVGAYADKLANILLEYGFDEQNSIYNNIRRFKNKSKKFYATIYKSENEVVVNHPNSDDTFFDEAYDFHGNSSQDLIDYLNQNGLKRENKMANGGGVVGQEVVIDFQGDEKRGYIKEITDSGDYIVNTDDGRTVFAQKDIDLISLGGMHKQSPMPKQKRFGFFENGGSMGDQGM